MSSLIDKINYLSLTKEEIRKAIMSHGVTVDPNITFRDYAKLISQLSIKDDSVSTDNKIINVTETVSLSVNKKSAKCVNISNNEIVYITPTDFNILLKYGGY